MKKFFVNQMPVTTSGEGPAPLHEMAAIYYEVWNAETCDVLGSYWTREQAQKWADLYNEIEEAQ